MSVARAQREISSAEFREWQVFWAIKANDEDPELAKYDSPEVRRAKIERKQERKKKRG